MHNAMVMAALIVTALGTTGCMQGFGAMNDITTNYCVSGSSSAASSRAPRPHRSHRRY